MSKTTKPASKTSNTAVEEIMQATLDRADGSEHCNRGHALDEANVIVWRSAPSSLRCKACYELKRAEQKARKTKVTKLKKPAKKRTAAQRSAAAKKAARTRAAKKLAA